MLVFPLNDLSNDVAWAARRIGVRRVLVANGWNQKPDRFPVKRGVVCRMYTSGVSMKQRPTSSRSPVIVKASGS